jgi:hypothetical protein
MAIQKMAVSARRTRVATTSCLARYFFGALKSTVGGLEISASF